MEDDILCRECSDRFHTLLRSATRTTRQVNADSSKYEQRVSRSIERVTDSPKQVAQTVLESPGWETQSEAESLEKQRLQRVRLRAKRKLASKYIGFTLLGTGLAALGVATMFKSTILTFTGLGLTFWGMLAFFVQPQNYVPSDLMSATALSSLKTIDKIVTDGIGYREKAVYIPANNHEKVVAFIPSEPFSRIPQGSEIEGKTRLNDPEGLLVVPPGLALSNLIESTLGFDLKNCGVDTLTRTLPKVLVEDLGIVGDVGIEVKGDFVKITLVHSVYADFCRDVIETSRRCGLGCPMCSALACILAIATGKPVLSTEERSSQKDGTTESYFQLLNEPRL